MAHIRCRVAGLALLVALGLTGCSSADKTPVDTSMSVTVNFKDVHRCSRISPEITVLYPPKGTSYYEVRVSTLGNPSRFLGGGRWAYDGINEDGADVIPEGALVNSYRGPCPQSGASGEKMFRFTVFAMTRESGTPLATATCTLNLEDE